MAKTGAQLREIRERKGISVRKLAKVVGISAPYLSDIELERRSHNPKTIARIVAALAEVKKVERA